MSQRRKRLWFGFFWIIIWLVAFTVKLAHLQFEHHETTKNWIGGAPLLAADDYSEPTGRLDGARNVVTVKPTSPSAVNAHRKVPTIRHVLPQKRNVPVGNSTIRIENSTFFQWKLNLTTRLERANKIRASRERGKTILQSLDTSRITESSHQKIVNETIVGKRNVVLIRASNNGRILPAQVIKEELRKKFHASLQFSVITRLERIYYINMSHRPRKRAIMESWLSKQPIPYQRVPGQKGQKDTCIPRKQGRRCIGISGLARTNLKLLDALNDTTGITLVVEDDFVIRDMSKLLASVHLVPPDWDILRWDCWDQPLPHFDRYPFSFKNAPITSQVCEDIQRPCHFCGGTHVAMWKGGESLEKLRRIWGTPPHDGIDCQLNHPSINSYCIQVGVGEFHVPITEWSDIPKTKDDLLL